MDQWFVDLFDIISSQKKTSKMDLLLPELYSEFDILARNDNIDELSEVCQYITDENPFKTINKEYNTKANILCKKEVIKRLVILNDYNILDDEFNQILNTNSKKKVKDYLEMWSDNIIVSMHLKDIKNQFIPTVSVKPKKRTVKIKESVIDEFPEMKIKHDLEEKSIIEEKTKDYEIEPVKLEPFIEEEIIEPEVKIKEDLKVETKEKATPKKEAPVKTVITRKAETETPIIKAKEIPIPKVVVETKKAPQRSEKEILLSFVDMAIYKYKISINKEIIQNQTNPRRVIFGVMKDFVDETERNTTFFIELFQLLIEYTLDSLVSYIAEKSDMLKKLCILNIGLLNETDTSDIFSILDILKNEDIVYIKESLAERDVRTYIDKYMNNEIETNDLINFSNLASRNAPKMMETHEAIKAIDYFKNNILYNKTRVLDKDNIDVLYWSMILSAVLGVYVTRKNVSNYIDSINYVSEIANKLVNKIDILKIKSNIQFLAISYIRRIYKCGTSSPNYDNWWQKQKDDLQDAKLNALSILRPNE